MLLAFYRTFNYLRMYFDMGVRGRIWAESLGKGYPSNGVFFRYGSLFITVVVYNLWKNLIKKGFRVLKSSISYLDFRSEFREPYVNLYEEVSVSSLSFPYNYVFHDGF